MKKLTICSGVGVILALIPVAEIHPQPQKTVDFRSDVQPILSKNCKSCHQGGAPPADLRLDSASAVMQGSISGNVVIAGKPDDSLLLRRINGQDGLRMPLSGRPLSEGEIAIIRAWIEQGAKTDVSDVATTNQPTRSKHWAYEKPVKPSLPTVRDTAWVRNAIDRFVLATLEKEGFQPSPEASKETLIRRVSLDLTGLPPSLAEVDAFVNDTRADAYERLVDRLLASPHYGERWATPWLDLARYGDSEGWTNDRQRVAWPYRDWVIRALNDNMPFDEFTIEQLAGDMLPNATTDQKIATGFIRSSMLQSEGGTDPEENNWNAQIDRTTTVGTTWLGSSIGCAQCHNHKYDPFTQKQFYQMVAFFNNSAFTGERGDPRLVALGIRFCCMEPKLDLPTKEQAEKRDAVRAEMKQHEDQLNDSSPAARQREAAWERNVLAAEKQWQPLIATRVESKAGTKLLVSPDASILASGENPDADTYILEGKAPVSGITGIRIEALPHSSLPGGGPGRDLYGNFMVHEVTVEAGDVNHLSKVELGRIHNDNAHIATKRQVWVVDATNTSAASMGEKVAGVAERQRFQLLMVPKEPIKLGPDGMLRLTITQDPDTPGANLGNFRISVTSGADPNMTLEVPSHLRSLLSIPPDQRTPEQVEDLTDQYRMVAPELAPAREKIAELRAKIESLNIPRALIIAEDTKIAHPTTYMRLRGSYAAKGELVESGVPAFLGPLPSGASPNRLGLAKWLVSRDNPLTARVTVNRFWETIFGRGIVETVEDFGTQGARPSHPELLDWLATEFMDGGWDVKAIKRLIVTSNTYRQSSVVTPSLLERDPVNALLARGPRFRVEGEMVRDITLAASGLLSAKMFGPPVMPYQPPGLWDGFPGLRLTADEWTLSPGEDKHRRALYVFIRRSMRYPSLTVFDAPSREFCTARRTRSDTPLQALTTLNDPAFFGDARGMAKRVLAEGGSNASARATYAFRLATSRRPSAKELDSLLSSFDKTLKQFQGDLAGAARVSGEPDAELASWTMLSNALLNLDETLTKE